MCEFPLFEVVCLRNYWWCGDSPCWYERNYQSSQSLEYTVSMLTFFAALHQKCENYPSLKSSVSVIIDDAETFGTGL
jgi:hypothetical protein